MKRLLAHLQAIRGAGCVAVNEVGQYLGLPQPGQRAPGHHPDDQGTCRWGPRGDVRRPAPGRPLLRYRMPRFNAPIDVRFLGGLQAGGCLLAQVG